MKNSYLILYKCFCICQIKLAVACPIYYICIGYMIYQLLLEIIVLHLSILG